VSDQLAVRDIAGRFTLPWSAYVRLLSVKDEQARKFYEIEALRGGEQLWKYATGTRTTKVQ